MLKQEAYILSNLDHPNIVKFKEVVPSVFLDVNTLFFLNFSGD